MGRILATGALMFLVLPVSPASAHAAYKDSAPANKSSVSSPPSEVWAEFTEPPSQSSRLEIFDPCGERVDSGSSSVVAYRITTAMSADKQGVYTARFYVTSDLDSHPTTGSFSFTSSGGAPCPGAEEESQADERPDGDGGGAEDGSEVGGAEDGPEVGEESATSGSERASSEGGEGDLRGTEQDASGSTAERVSETRKKKHGGKHGKNHGGGKRQDKKSQKDDSVSSTAESSAENPSGSPSEGDIPMDWLMISFGIAGAVGAAGGKVYAGLMGPR